MQNCLWEATGQLTCNRKPTDRVFEGFKDEEHFGFADLKTGTIKKYNSAGKVVASAPLTAAHRTIISNIPK